MKKLIKLFFVERSTSEKSPYYYTSTDTSDETDYIYKPCFIVLDSNDGVWIDAGYADWKMMVRSFKTII